MTPYEIGFAAGEQQAFQDRRHGIRRQHPGGPFRNDRHRGWWDGYTPRSPAWALRNAPLRPFHETQQEAA